MISIPDISTLTPVKQGDRLYLFPFGGTGLVKLDLLFEAGSAYQRQKLCASATNKLITVATKSMDSAQMSEFMDFCGIVCETNSDVLQSTLTFYFLRRYADELLPVVREMVCNPRFDEGDFEAWRNHRRQEILQHEKKTSFIARRMFYEALFSSEHPLGRYATAADADRLTIDTVKAHHAAYYGLDKATVVAAGNIDDCLIAEIAGKLGVRSSEFGVNAAAPGQLRTPISELRTAINQTINQTIIGATQTSIRVGRILPLAWDSMDYARFMLLTTVLGGYFGSRLMSNLREDKGYTYGIYARTQIYRGAIVFFVTADVAAGMADAALEEIFKEMESLRNEPVGDDELALVKTVMAGDFLRSVDGIFERSARFCDMLGTGVDERLTEGIRSSLAETTPSQLQELAQRLLSPTSMTVCTAGEK